MSLLDELLELERQGWNALCEGSGSEFYGQIMMREAVMILTHGTMMDRRSVVESLKHAPRWDEFDLRDPHVIGLDESAAVLVYRGRSRRADADWFDALMASCYVRRDGRWRLASYQQTVVPSDQDAMPGR